MRLPVLRILLASLLSATTNLHSEFCTTSVHHPDVFPLCLLYTGSLHCFSYTACFCLCPLRPIPKIHAHRSSASVWKGI